MKKAVDCEMAGFYMDQKEVIRIKVKKCDGKTQAAYKKFSIDPQITSFEMLQGILARAFEISSDFTISYMTRDSEGQDVYQSMLSDWDMDAAFQCASEPYLKLRVDVRLFEDLEDWDVIAPVEIPRHRLPGFLDKHSILSTVTDSITHKLVRTVISMQRAMGFKHPENGVIKPIKAPMSDAEFRNYLDSVGFMVKPNEFRQSVYQGGIEHSLRRVAWRHLLSIYPAHLSSEDRFRYLKCKEDEYQKLKEEWCEKFRSDAVVEEVKHVVSMVEKDVLRTDRSHSFYSGSDENKNTLSLFHILVTYALTHPDVSYCQGMSDLASPLLVTQKNEGQAYICFCALMSRLHTNFTTEGNAIMMKFHHLSELLNMYDPVLYTHFLQNSDGDMFFCYRWFLLEMKREFPFNDALHILEVMWATLPPCPPKHELELTDPGYSSQLLSTSPCSPTFSQQHNMYTKLLALRRGGVLHRGNKSAKSAASSVPRAFANNNLSIDSLSNCDGVSTKRSSVSSFDTSPGDRDDRDISFPKIDQTVTYCLHQKLDNIGHILKNKQLYEKYDNVNGQTNSDVKENKIFSCTYNNDRNDSDWTVTNANYYCSTVTNNVYIEHSSNGLNDVSLYQENNGLTQQDPQLNDDRRSWSLHSISSDSSETDSQQIQFTLSIDSNTKNFADVPKTTADLRNCTSSTGSSSESVPNALLESQNTESLRTEVKSSDTWPKTTGLLLSTPKTFSPIASRHLPLQSGKSEMSKTMSDSHISDCQEATEEFGSSESNCSQFAGAPIRDPSKLPPPQEFGAGNPFLMFLCLTLLLQHREIILSQDMCYEEIAMYFDRLVRKHNANHTLHFTRQMYTEYLRAQQANVEDDDDQEFNLNL